MSLRVDRWRALAKELTAMEHVHHVAAMPVEKRLERGRAAEQVQAMVMAVLSEAAGAEDSERRVSGLPLVRAAAKYLLTAADRLRRASLLDAWSAHEQKPEQTQAAIQAAREWDDIMRALSTQFGVVHPFAEMVESLALGEREMQTLGVSLQSLHNGEDLLAL
ncbi:MAG TPA: hypothetical protein PK472_18015 [Pseudomonadota bacterium]|nr:hypothetical protein [Pseudomonadota bacterium]